MLYKYVLLFVSALKTVVLIILIYFIFEEMFALLYSICTIFKVY